LPPGSDDKNQQEVEGKKDGQNDRCLQIHLWAITPAPARAAKVFIYPAPQFQLKTIITAEG
jgi:hypothetical protein